MSLVVRSGPAFTNSGRPASSADDALLEITSTGTDHPAHWSCMPRTVPRTGSRLPRPEGSLQPVRFATNWSAFGPNPPRRLPSPTHCPTSRNSHLWVQ